METQRLKEAIWRVQANVRIGRMSRRRMQIIDQELELLAAALGVTTLAYDHECPYCGHVHKNANDKDA